MKKCYYTLLDVDKKATGDDIKQAYKKMAIFWHPDKNRSEEATQKFQEINEAYTVLSDPNERTWYDNHRNQILKNKDFNPDMTDEESELQTFGIDIWPFFTRGCFSDFNDEEKGFFAVYRTLFEGIKAQEEKAKQEFVDDEEEDKLDMEIGGKQAPGFGDSKMGIDKVLDFYKFWEHFYTFKQFGWTDLHNLSDAYNRQIKRLMEKENKKERQKEKKKYVETIINLVEYVKKRDPRYQEHAKAQILEKQKKQEALKKQENEKIRLLTELREKQRKEEAQRYLEESLQEQVVEETNEDDNDQNGHEEDFFCEICNKEFKTENQLKNHKPSKAHQKKVKELYDQVALEEEKGDIDDTTETQGKEETGGKSKKRRKKKKNQNNEIIINDNSSDWKLISPDKFKNEQPAKKSEPQKQKAPLSSAEENENQSADEEIDMIRYLNPGLKKTTKAENTEPTTDQEKIKDPNPDQ